MKIIHEQEQLFIYRSLYNRLNYIKNTNEIKWFHSHLYLCTMVVNLPRYKHEYSILLKSQMNDWWLCFPETRIYQIEDACFVSNDERLNFLKHKIDFLTKSYAVVLRSENTPLEEFSTPEMSIIDYGLFVVIFFFLSFMALFIYGLYSI